VEPWITQSAGAQVLVDEADHRSGPALRSTKVGRTSRKKCPTYIVPHTTHASAMTGISTVNR
jgi:hypothetical protein